MSLFQVGGIVTAIMILLIGMSIVGSVLEVVQYSPVIPF